jgi:hypothetical protein
MMLIMGVTISVHVGCKNRSEERIDASTLNMGSWNVEGSGSIWYFGV